MPKDEEDKPLQRDPIVDVANLLEQAGIEYAFTGSLAFAYWVEPRGTKDIDVAIAPSGRVELAGFLNVLRDVGLDVDPPAALRELDEWGYLGIQMPLAKGGVVVVELITSKLPLLQRQIVERAVSMPFPGRPAGIQVVTPEDLVLYKLIFFRPHPDRYDIERLLACHPALDTDYVRTQLESIFPESDERFAWFDSAVEGLEEG